MCALASAYSYRALLLRGRTCPAQHALRARRASGAGQHGAQRPVRVAQDAVQYAYFASYSYQRHQSMVADLQSRDGVRLEMMGQTLDGHDLDVLIIGAPGNTPP